MVIVGKNIVTPHAGVWIETSSWWLSLLHFDVTPHAGVWIETDGNQLRYDCG